MTLNITSTEIQIKNAQGITKFTSNDKLVYLKFRKIGSQSFNGFNFNYLIPFAEIDEKDFAIISIKFTSCNGNGIPPDLIGQWMPGNGSIVINFRAFGGGASGQPATETEILGLAVTTGGSVGYINICQYIGGGDSSNSEYLNAGAHSGTLEYDVKLYSYL